MSTHLDPVTPPSLDPQISAALEAAARWQPSSYTDENGNSERAHRAPSADSIAAALAEAGMKLVSSAERSLFDEFVAIAVEAANGTTSAETRDRAGVALRALRADPTTLAGIAIRGVGPAWFAAQESLPEYGYIHALIGGLDEAGQELWTAYAAYLYAENEMIELSGSGRTATSALADLRRVGQAAARPIEAGQSGGANPATA
jgi:hypothetical protein